MKDIRFDIPVALFIFKRQKSVLRILKVLETIKPKKIYLISDNGRNEAEKKLVFEVRNNIERAITWDCEIIRRYQAENVGVYENIAGGAKWVFEHEERAIFLEDDNLPEQSFFPFCEELLEKYNNESRVLWICGSNYLEECSPDNNADYVFSKNMLPCGWASWRDKFNTFYDGELSLYNNEIKKKVKQSYSNKKLYCQDMYNVEYELDFKKLHGRFYSWDYQMSFSLRAHDVYSIIPKYNQIKNIGVDNNSTHGGTSLSNIMVERFCERKTKELTFPLKHPNNITIDLKIEDALAEIIIDPGFFKFKSKFSRLIRNVFRLSKAVSIKNAILKK
ncbi:glycosyltransferase family 2 protein [Citrobacter freundii]|uniref:glycosyltransferase family 2 protein n=1 Tax=Citrobacter freundii TaxID=546 RepID=UPI0015EE6C32|nr:glycosyltransferase family 2 protein [Citrobacter freundii]QMG40583.1 glycosyltransferase family 2 protein [Citrobacter freundii]